MNDIPSGEQATIQAMTTEKLLLISRQHTVLSAVQLCYAYVCPKRFLHGAIAVVFQLALVMQQ